MRLKIDMHLDYGLTGPTDCLAQIKAAPGPDQQLLWERLETSGATPRETPAEEDIGTRLWVRESAALSWRYQAEVETHRQVADLPDLRADAPADLPHEVVQFLFPSRYCPSDKFLTFVATEFGQLTGGRQVAAMAAFVRDHFTYRMGSSTVDTSALETFVTRQGVCRDFAHMLITLARAATIPARIVSAYGPEVKPQDFHAVVEVWLDGGWHLVDPSGMSSPTEVVRICVGRDATDVAFLTTYGPAFLRRQSVDVIRV